MPTLRWLTRDSDMRAAEKVPYRLLEEVPSLGHGDRDAGNMLIQGDNLEALKSLLPFYGGRVKCIYIDPPYNTGSAFEHYDDNLEHSQWLAMMWPRLELLRELLAEDGSIWVSIDNFQAPYLKVMMDEIFGRNRYVTTCVWQQRTTRENRKVFSEDHEFLHIYAADPEKFKTSRNQLPLSDEVRGRYKNPDSDPRGAWQSVSANAQAGHATESQFYIVEAPNGKLHTLPQGRCWLFTKERFDEQVRAGNIWFGKDGNGVPRVKKFLSDITGGLTPNTLWLAEESGTNDEAKKQTIKILNDATVFDTPKPERLIERILHIATNPGDLVLDSFLGSGTTAAVAQKMGRRYIGIEMGDHAITHCQPRLAKVVDGEQGGISKAQNWQGGGGFRFFKLGAAVFDETGGLQADIRFPTLAAHIWFSEMNQPWTPPAPLTPFLGALDGKGVALLYNGILGDKSMNGGNVLNRQTLRIIRDAAAGFTGPMVIYGERTVLSEASLEAEDISFKQTPYDVRARK